MCLRRKACSTRWLSVLSPCSSWQDSLRFFVGMVLDCLGCDCNVFRCSRSILNGISTAVAFLLLFLSMLVHFGEGYEQHGHFAHYFAAGGSTGFMCFLSCLPASIHQSTKSFTNYRHIHIHVPDIGPNLLSQIPAHPYSPTSCTHTSTHVCLW